MKTIDRTSPKSPRALRNSYAENFPKKPAYKSLIKRGWWVLVAWIDGPDEKALVLVKGKQDLTVWFPDRRDNVIDFGIEYSQVRSVIGHAAVPDHV